MKKTETYQLGLIETSDTFSPETLNENAQKVEAAIAAESAARKSADTAEAQARASAVAALDQRLKVFEARHIVFGTYNPGTVETSIYLGFRPKAFLITANGGFANLQLSNKGVVTFTDTGFTVDASSGTTGGIHGPYNYIALD